MMMMTGLSGAVLGELVGLLSSPFEAGVASRLCPSAARPIDPVPLRTFRAAVLPALLLGHVCAAATALGNALEHGVTKGLAERIVQLQSAAVRGDEAAVSNACRSIREVRACILCSGD